MSASCDARALADNHAMCCYRRATTREAFQEPITQSFSVPLRLWHMNI